MRDCTHRLCEIIGGPCAIAVRRSRGCRATAWPVDVAPEVFDEVRELLAAIDAGDRAAAIRLAQIIRTEALEDRHLLKHARDDEPELSGPLAYLVARR